MRRQRTAGQAIGAIGRQRLAGVVVARGVIARLAIFIIYFWFGILKIIGLSPAGPLVHALFDRTIHFMSFDVFYLLFALFEVVIGILILIPRFTRVAILLLFVHLIATVLPLFLLPHIAWQSAFVPTLEGQYIIKNVLILALAMVVVANTNPIPWAEFLKRD